MLTPSLSSIADTVFFNENFERRHFHYRSAFDPAALFKGVNKYEIGKVVVAGYLQRLEFDVITEGTGRRVNEHIKGELIDPIAVLEDLRKGSSLRLLNVHRKFASIDSLRREISQRFGCPVFVNGYLTPAEKQGFDPHYDAHDVLIFQVEGSKDWTIFDTGPDQIVLPLRHQTFKKGVHLPGEPIDSFRMEPGDALYIPRGRFHCAQATNLASIHLTYGVHVATWATVMIELLSEAASKCIEIRSAIIDGQDLDPTLIERVLEAVTDELKNPAKLKTCIDRCAADGTMPDAIPPDAFSDIFKIGAKVHEEGAAS